MIALPAPLGTARACSAVCQGELIGNVNNEGATDAEQRVIARRAYEKEIGDSTQRDGGKAVRAWRLLRARYGSSLDAIKRAFCNRCTGIDFSKAVGETLVNGLLDDGSDLT